MGRETQKIKSQCLLNGHLLKQKPQHFGTDVIVKFVKQLSYEMSF